MFLAMIRSILHVMLAQVLNFFARARHPFVMERRNMKWCCFGRNLEPSGIASS